MVGGRENQKERERERETTQQTIFRFPNVKSNEKAFAHITSPTPVTFCRHLFSFENSNRISFDLLNFILKLQKGEGS